MSAIFINQNMEVLRRRLCFFKFPSFGKLSVFLDPNRADGASFCVVESLRLNDFASYSCSSVFVLH
jgi:hypothetical protein